MSALGQQFEQTAMDIKDTNFAPERISNANRAQYHLNRDTPAVDLARKGQPFVSLPTPDASGIMSKKHLLVPSEHPNFRDIPGERKRENYSHGGEGQRVMGLPREGLENFHTLDKHGNAFDEAHIPGSDYATYGPQMSQRHEDIWAQHAKTTMLPSTTILHTAQPSVDTGDHSYITGPLNKDEPAAHVMIQHGIPKFMDGHHTTAEWRGRGHSEFPARILNLDQLGPHVTKLFDHANAKDNRDLIDPNTPFNQRKS